MLNNQEFISLERRLWAEGNPLCDELIYLLSEAKKVMEKYSPVLSKLADADDLDFYREWDNFGDTLDNIAYALGMDL